MQTHLIDDGKLVEGVGDIDKRKRCVLRCCNRSGCACLRSVDDPNHADQRGGCRLNIGKHAHHNANRTEKPVKDQCRSGNRTDRDKILSDQVKAHAQNSNQRYALCAVIAGKGPGNKSEYRNRNIPRLA